MQRQAPWAVAAAPSVVPDSLSALRSSRAQPEPVCLFGPCIGAVNVSANVLVPRAGSVILSFDNSGAWLRSRTVRFRARLEDGESAKGVAGLSDV